MFAVFIDQVSPRIHYVFEELIGRRLGQELHFISDPVTFKDFNAPYKIQYLDKQHVGLPGLFVQRADFMLSVDVDPYFDPSVGHFKLSEAAINQLEKKTRAFLLPTDETDRINRVYRETFPCLFVSEGVLGFDFFAMAFYFFSRYEEYQDFSSDMHGRFHFEHSILAPYEYNPAPYVDIAFFELLSHLNAHHLIPEAKVIATFDIDIAFRFKGRSLHRQFISTLRYPRHLIDRFRTWINGKDPFDPETTVFDFIKNNEVQSRVFWLVNRKLRGVNRQVNRRFSLFIQRIKTAAASYSIGLHPSYSHNPEFHWKEEKEWLEKVTESTITHSRQHFVHLLFPDTYTILNELGITDDWSMGYADTVGFRAGTAYDFLWFDLSKNETTNLRIHPFCIMDVTAKNYLKLDPYAAIDIGRSLKELVFLFGGNFTFIAHNESLSNTEGWENWKPVFESWARKQIVVGDSLKR